MELPGIMSDHQTKLRNKLRSYRFARFGSLFLFVMALLALFLTWVTNNPNANVSGICIMAIIWPAATYFCHLKVKAISTELRELEDYTNV